jgi:hypothetical protein
MGSTRASRGRLVRWRWRLSGAVMWPTFVAGLLLDVLVLHELPLAQSGTSVADAFLLAGIMNLAIVAVLAPLLGSVVRRLRRDLPRVVAVDHAGTVLLVGLALALLAAGVLEHPRVASAQRSFRAQSEAMRSYVDRSQTPEYQRNLRRADSVQLDTHLYRTCVPGADPSRALCAFIDTSTAPPTLRPDPDRAPNSSYFNRRPGDFSTSP